MRHLVMIALLFAAARSSAGETGTWPAFLGQEAGPVDPTSIPLTWSPTENVAWKAETPGHGQSSPIVWKDRIFVTAIEGPNKDTNHVLCLSLVDGKELWRNSTPTALPVKDSLYVSRAAPTPCADANRVYCYFESGDLFALTHDGKEVWRRNLTKDYGPPKNEFGLAASPVQTDDAVIALVDDDGPSYLVAVSKADGSTLWKTDRTSRRSWSSPALVPVDGQPQIVVSSAGGLDGYDPTTGALLWSYREKLGGNTAVTPLPYAEGRFLVGGSAGRDGGSAEDAKQTNFAMEIGLRTGVSQSPGVTEIASGWVPEVLWRSEKAMPSFGSPIVHAGHAYWVNRQGVVYCLDAETGEERYTERAGESVWATPLGLGDRIYLFGKEGLTTVLAAGPEFKVLAENRLWNPDEIKPDPAAAANESTEERRRAAANFAGRTQYGIAAVDGSLLVRTGDVIYCVKQTN